MHQCTPQMDHPGFTPQVIHHLPVYLLLQKRYKLRETRPVPYPIEAWAFIWSFYLLTVLDAIQDSQALLF